MAKQGSEILESITIHLTPEQRAAVEREAKAMDRTVSGQVRFWVAEAVRNGKPVLAPWPPPLTEPGESIETTRTRLAALIDERDRLVACERKQRWSFPLQAEERLHRVRNMIDSLEPLVRLADRLAAREKMEQTT
jgi:hypothetical protein